MSSKLLLDNAVGLSSHESQREGRSLLDKLFVHWFNRLVYPLIWEDPVSDMAALGDISGQNMVCLTSGGCNVLSYLSGQPAHIAAVDLNEAHLALLALKQTAATHLTYDEFHRLFALANLPSNEALMAKVMPHLPVYAQQYWGSVQDKGRAAWFSRDFYKEGLLGNFIGFGHWLAKRLGYDLSVIMQAKTQEEAAEIFDQRIAPLFDHKVVRWLSSQVWVLYGLGIPPRQYQVLKGDASHMADVLKARLRHLACDYPLADNYFAWQAFARRFNAEDQQALPLYLQQQHYAHTQQAQDRVSIYHQSVTDYLATRPAMSVDVFVFLDAQDWMSESQLNALWTEVNRTARLGARVIFRAAGAESPLEAMLSPHLLATWTTDQQKNTAFWQADRSAIYGGCFIYTRTV
ncbi:MAG: BtaA family protein [Thiotrichales bacterium]|jgi:S-adenosylmethionine-diacylglycerol 3-amino-3-carboxypropyl transferase|nr:BtaA family protein [Thiotrichales bacterium]